MNLVDEMRCDRMAVGLVELCGKVVLFAVIGVRRCELMKPPWCSVEAAARSSLRQKLPRMSPRLSGTRIAPGAIESPATIGWTERSVTENDYSVFQLHL